MERLRRLLWAGLGVLALSLPAAAASSAQAGDICAAMSQIAISARERPAFRSVRRALAGGERVVPGFEAGECRATVDGIECRGRRYGGAFRDWPDLATCRGVTPFQPQLALPRPRWPSNRSYRFGRFLIERGYMCPGCRALGPSFFNMTFYRARAAGRPRR